MALSHPPQVVHLLECDRWICHDCWEALVEDAYPRDLPDYQWRHLDTTADDERYIRDGGCQYWLTHGETR